METNKSKIIVITCGVLSLILSAGTGFVNYGLKGNIF